MNIILIFATISALIGLFISVNEYFKTRTDKLLTHPADLPTPTGKRDISRSSRPSAESDERSNIDLSRLPRPSAVLIGRTEELTQLTTALNNEKQYLAYLCAGGGVGKSALTFTWLQNMQPKYHNVEKVLAWSFYSQGSHDTQNSSVPFFQVALPFFGFAGELPKEDVAKGRALARCLRDKSFILVLDGLEPLQHPTHILDGELKDVAIKAFLEEVQYHGLTQPPSLIVISSRQPLVELTSNAWPTERYITIDLQTLPMTDGAKLLTQLGVKGTTTELEQASEEMGGHALALVLLGRMLVKQFAGKIERRDQLPPLWTEAKLGGHALRVLRWYENYYAANGSANHVFLGLLGLFDHPMGRVEKEILVAKADHAAPLRALEEVGWQQLETTLENAGVLLRSEGTRTHWDCHSLIRSYFAQRFKETRLQHYQQAHRVLFDHYQSVPTKHQPDTIEELEPLYRAVVHGCLAGEYQKTLDVYRQRILRGKEHYNTSELGAYSQDLTTLAAFFPQGWSQQPVQQGLSEADQAWLLAEASFCLLSLGRLVEAVEPRKANKKLLEKQENWKSASRSDRNLVDLMLPLGRLAEAIQAAQQAIDSAKKSKDLFEQTKTHARFATVLHWQGQLAQAAQNFARAEQLQQQNEPDSPQLYSLAGFQYCALLLDQATDKAGVEQVLARGEYILKTASEKKRLLDISLGHLTLARAYLKLEQFEEATTQFDQAVAGIRKAGKIDRTPPFLIDRANFYLRPSRLNLEALKTAAQDLQEADSLIRRCGMKLYEVDCQLAWCRYYLAREEKETARKCWEQAKVGMEMTGYGLRAGEVRELEKASG
jgi:tetratricopeptide (TPR) repeat protein